MPNPEGDGKGSPILNVGFGVAEVGAVQAAESNAASQGTTSHAGDGGTFWDQAASAAHSETAGLTSVSGSAAVIGLDQAATETSTHDFSSALDSSAHTETFVGAAAHDTGFAATSLEHADFGTAALHSALNLSGFANQMHI